MKTIIYIDTLFLINLIMDIYIYSLTAFILNKKTSILKIGGISLFGALYAVFIFFPEIKLLYNGIFKILFLLITTGLLFGFSDLKQLIKNTVICMLTAAVFCGCIWTLIAVSGISAKTGAVISNGILYLDINPLILLFGILLSIVSLIFLKAYQEREFLSGKVYSLDIKINEKSYHIEALCDTGCRLKSEDGTLPAIIVEQGIFEEEFYGEAVGIFKITYSTVSNKQETALSFIPENISDKKHTYSAVIVLSPVSEFDRDSHFNAVMNPDVLKTRIPSKNEGFQNINFSKRKEIFKND